MEKDKAEIVPVLIREFQATLSLTEKSVPRRMRFPEAQNVVKVAIGMRRSGKTYFLFQTIHHLIKNNIPIDRIFYLNFEDDRILPLNAKQMGQMIDEWYSVHPNHQTCYLFLDEVQNVDGWPLVIRRLLDKKNIQIYITGSSARLLSKEIATSLRGRSLSVEVLPFSFSEYLDCHHLPSTQETLLDYFAIGGFPAIQTMNEKEKLETLQNYVETVIFRDIVERYQITNIALLRYLISCLLKAVAAPFSINKFYNDIKSQAYKVAKDTLYSYFTYLEDAFLIFTVPIFTESLRQRQTTPKKIYAVDNGLIAANTFNMSDNLGKKLENQVYLDLRRQEKKIFYYQTSSGYEIDFIAQNLRGNIEIVQVVWDASDTATRKREERALHEAEKELGCKGKLIDWKTYLQEFA